MFKIFTILLSSVIISCGPLDSRDAIINISKSGPELIIPTTIAINAWKRATKGDINWKVGTCDSSDLTRDNICFNIKFGDPGYSLSVDQSQKNYWGEYSPADALTRVSRGGPYDGNAVIIVGKQAFIDYELPMRAAVIAHEFGHALRLHHVLNSKDIMYYAGDSKFCITNDTLIQYEELYHINNVEEVCFAFQNGDNWNIDPSLELD